MKLKESKAMIKKAFYISIVIVYFCNCSLKAQQDSQISITVPEMKIYQAENNGNVEYVFKSWQNYVSIKGDILKVVPFKNNYAVNINDMRRMTLQSGNYFWQDALWGSIIGFVTGFALGIGSFIIDNPRGDVSSGIAGGLMLTLPFAAIFGAFGTGMQRDIDFDLGNYPVPEKKALIIKILQDNKIK
jgi:hypothetical protein